MLINIWGSGVALPVFRIERSSLGHVHGLDLSDGSKTGRNKIQLNMKMPWVKKSGFPSMGLPPFIIHGWIFPSIFPSRTIHEFNGYPHRKPPWGCVFRSYAMPSRRASCWRSPELSLGDPSRNGWFEIGLGIFLTKKHIWTFDGCDENR